MPKAQATPAPPSGSRGRFVIEGELGRGGMGAVYRVRDANTGKRFALKRVWSSDNARAARRTASLEREFQTLAHLRHPRIIEVYDYGVDSDGPYYTMELLDGADLEQGGRLPWQEACALLRDIASSLAIVHSRGLIHRDVSTRNVRRTADGRAKLLDFGGLVSMGVANDVIGTPPFMPPEALQLQALDARADLFSLGALAYYLLTGRHAYPARRTSDLRDAWRTRPTVLSRAFVEIPAALSNLVLQLLALDRGARPQTAAEVMERLCVIADLPKEDLPEIQRGYLAMPTLAGRQTALLAIRSRMLALVRGDGGALLIEGSAGSGRSRMIDACSFEAKLLGALVMRADAGAATEPWGVARSISAQLFAALPEQASEAARRSANILGHVVDAVRQDDTVSIAMDAPERSLMLLELRDFVLSLARKQRIVLVIDDVERIDEPSIAWLASVANKAARHSLLVVAALSTERDADEPSALNLLRSLGVHVELSALDAEQTEAVLRSVFGEAVNLRLIAGRINELAHGSPRAIMELAQQLVDRGLARYETGSWLLPSRLDASDLPATPAESLRRRLDALSADARDFAEVLCVADSLRFTPSTYVTLTSHANRDRTFRALEELVAARVLIAGEDHYRFSQRGFTPVLLSGLSALRKAGIHHRLADLIAQTGGDPLLRAAQLMAAGMQGEAVNILSSMDLQLRVPPLALLEGAVAHAAESRSLPACALQRLRMALMAQASVRSEADSFKRELKPVLALLERESGLARYHELVGVPEGTRLSQALAEQQQRYLNTPQDEQVYDVGAAVRELSRTTAATLSLAGATFDIDLIDQLPALDPLLPLSPALRVVSQLKGTTRDWLAGRAERACQQFEQTLQRLREPDRAGLDDVQFARIEAAANYILGLHEAVNGIDRAEQRAQFLEKRRALRVNAWRVRSLLKLCQGDADGALDAMRRSEVLQLQDENDTYYPGTGTGFYLYAYFNSADLLGVKRVLDSVSTLAVQHAGWRSTRINAEVCYRYLSGDLTGAFERMNEARELTLPGRHLSWGFMCVLDIRLLRELGRIPEALARAEQCLAIMEQGELYMTRYPLMTETALTRAAAGLHAEAVAMVEHVIESLRAAGSRGLALGVHYEARARIAIIMGDRASFERAAESCARQYDQNNPALSARFARLMEEARRQGLAPAEVESFEQPLRVTSQRPERDEDNGVVSRLLECVDTSDRARCALTMLLQSTESYLGHLYGVEGDRLLPIAGLPTCGAEPELDQWLRHWFAAECELAARLSANELVTQSFPPANNDEADDSEVVTGSVDVVHASGVSSEFVDAEGQRFFAVMVVQERGRQRYAAAVFASHMDVGARRRPPARLLARIANVLLQHGDVRGTLLA